MATLANMVVRLTADTKALDVGLKKTQTKMMAFSAKTKAIGAGMTKFMTLPILAFGAATFASANDFDKAYKNIRAGTGATGKKLQGLKKDFKSVFKKVPENANDVSTAVADLNTRLGLSGKPLQKMTKKMLDLARISHTQVGPTVRDTTRVFGDWSIKTENQSKAMNHLWKVSQTTGIGMSKLSQNVVTYGVQFRSLGFSLKDATALLGKWEKEGVASEKILGVLSMGLGKMAKAGKEPIPAFKELIKNIKEAKTSGEAMSISVEALGTRAGPDFAAAVREGRLELGTLLGKLKKSPETIDKAAKSTLTFSDKLKMLKNKAETALAPVGKDLLGAIEGLIPVAQSAIKSFTGLIKKFEALPKATQKTYIKWAVFGAVAGPVILAIGNIARGVSGLISALPVIGKAFQGLFLIIEANPIAALGLALAGLVTYFAVTFHPALDATKKKYGDITLAVEGLRIAEANLKTSRDGRKKAAREYEEQLINLNRNTRYLTTKQGEYNTAVSEYGPNSEQAKIASDNLKEAQLNLKNQEDITMAAHDKLVKKEHEIQTNAIEATTATKQMKDMIHAAGGNSISTADQFSVTVTRFSNIESMADRAKKSIGRYNTAIKNSITPAYAKFMLPLPKIPAGPAFAAGGLTGLHGPETITTGERGVEGVIDAPGLKSLQKLGIPVQATATKSKSDTNITIKQIINNTADAIIMARELAWQMGL